MQPVRRAGAGDATGIAPSATSNYGVTFPLFAKIDVNGANAAPLYQLPEKPRSPGLLGTEAIKWNFTKFLVDRKGDVVARYAPNVTRSRWPATSKKLLYARDHEPNAPRRARGDRADGANAGFRRGAGRPEQDPAGRCAKLAERASTRRRSNDIYSNYVNRVIFDPLYNYDYLARPYKIVPNTAAALPEISADGMTWTIKIKPGIYFSDDPAFKGKKRELTATDYVYSWKRLIDPKLRSTQRADPRRRLRRSEGRHRQREGDPARIRLRRAMEGLRRRSTATRCGSSSSAVLRPRRTSRTSQTAAVAREVVEAYGDASTWVMENPVGTGPYRLKEWRRGQKIVLEASPTFRDERYFPTARSRTIASSSPR